MKGIVLSDVETLGKPFGVLCSQDEVHSFLEDLFTPDEIERFANRWRVMRLLASGLKSGEVHSATGISRTTIARAKRMVQGGTGIIAQIVDRLETS